MDEKTRRITMQVNYKNIFRDIIRFKHPDKKIACEAILNKLELDSLDVWHLNKLIFGRESEGDLQSKRYQSYDFKTIEKILDYQKEYQLNNTETAQKFNLSRNTLNSWKKRQLVK